MSSKTGFKNRASIQFNAIASLGWERWEFKAPVCAGDSIHCKISTVAKRKTSRDDRGIVKLFFEVYNQDCVLVQSGTNNLLITI